MECEALLRFSVQMATGPYPETVDFSRIVTSPLHLFRCVQYLFSYISVMFMMPFTSTYRFIILVMIWLYHLATGLDINAGYYVNPFFQQPQNLRRSSVPQLTWSTYIFSGHNTVPTRDRSLVDNHNHLMTRENPVVDNHNHLMTRKNPVVDNQNHAMTQENPVVVNQGQNLDDSFKQIQPKCSLCPHRGTKELTHRGGDSVTSVKDRDVQQGGSDIKHVSGGGSVPLGSRTNDVPAGSTNTLFPTVADPSRCVWAIISCCSPGSSNIRNPCFELLGCPGPFWDTNPCNESITGTALKVVGEFYSNGKFE
jgi:hypothetical protein